MTRNIDSEREVRFNELITVFLDKVINSIDEGLSIDIVFLDLAKAFLDLAISVSLFVAESHRALYCDLYYFYRAA